MCDGMPCVSEEPMHANCCCCRTVGEIDRYSQIVSMAVVVGRRKHHANDMDDKLTRMPATNQLLMQADLTMCGGRDMETADDLLIFENSLVMPRQSTFQARP